MLLPLQIFVMIVFTWTMMNFNSITYLSLTTNTRRLSNDVRIRSSATTINHDKFFVKISTLVAMVKPRNYPNCLIMRYIFSSEFIFQIEFHLTY